MTVETGARRLARGVNLCGFSRSAFGSTLLGLLSLLCFGLFAAPGHAAEARHPVVRHRIIRRIVVRKLVVAHVVRRAVVRHVAWHKPAPRRIIRHVVLRRRVILRRPDLHKPVWHKPVWHKPIWHPAVWHKPVWHKPVWHPAAVYGPRMSCVPFARAATGMDITGDAYAWWHNAAGHYARGDVPVPGSVLAFRANARMRLGHVAVVTRVINRREVLVDQANWADWGQITRGVPVIDVSENNTWSDVRVSIGGGRFGSVYPTYGFIYNRPDTGAVLARRAPAPLVAANPAPSDLRALHPFGGTQEAMAPERLPAPPRWPTRLGHQLVVHPMIRHVVYRRPAPRHWVRRPVRREVIRRRVVHR